MNSTVLGIVIGCLLGAIFLGCCGCFGIVLAYRLFWDYELHVLMRADVSRAKLRAGRHVYLRSDVAAAAERCGQTMDMFEESGREYVRVRADVLRSWEDALLPRPGA